MFETSFLSKGDKSPVFRRMPGFIGLFVAWFGALIILSWHLHWRFVLQMLPNTAPMQYNTALCFILTGLGLFLLGRGSDRFAGWLGGATAFFSLLTLFEYSTGHNLGIDQLFFKPYFQASTVYPGRMSPLAVFNFIFIGSAIVMAGSRRRWIHWLTGTGLLACIAGVIAFVAVFGFALGVDAAYGWGAYSHIAVNTSVLFLLLCAGLLSWAWEAARAASFNFLRWLPVTGSVTLMVMIAFVSTTNMSLLLRASNVRKHTFDVILAAQSFEETLIDIQRGVRGYITLGDKQALADFYANSRIEPQKFNALVELTADDHAQQERLKVLSRAMDDVFGYDQRVIELFNAQGATAALESDTNGVNRAVFTAARTAIKTISEQEQKLLITHSSVEDSNASNAQRLLIFGSITAALLLVVANAMASRELQTRRRTESKLREVSTLQSAIFNSANYAIIALDAKGIVKSFNPHAERMLGYSAEEVVGRVTPMLWRDAGEIVAQANKMSEELGRTIKPGIDVLLTNGAIKRVDEYEVTYVRKDGSRFPAWVSFTALTEDDGTATGYLGIISDVTERRKNEAVLRENEERFRGAFDDAPIGMALVSPLGKWLKVNHAICTMLGYSSAELLATDFQAITHPDDLALDLEYVREMLAGNISSYQMEKRYFHKAGLTVFVMLSVSLVRDHAGQPLYFISQIENITERKSQQAETEKMIVELQSVIGQVKTLSGLIPICGWCKNIRSNSGSWQTVEQFVHSRTDATFSHGMCPTCAEKFKADIIKNGLFPLPATEHVPVGTV